MTHNSMATSSHSERWKPDVIIVDGRHLLYRASDVHSDLEAEVDGEMVPTGGVYGLLTVLVKLRRRYGGRYMMAWEGEGNYRYKLYPDYKRKDPPTNDQKQFYTALIQQEQMVRVILAKLGVRQYDSIGGEADDVIGTLAKVIGGRHGLKCAIFSADSDLQQLVTETTRCIVPQRRNKERIMDEYAVKERWGVEPNELALLKALAGDGSDNIPGIPHVGPVMAARFINTYGGLAEIVSAAQDQKTWAFSERYRSLVRTHSSNALLFLRLTTVQDHIQLKEHPIDVDPMGARKLMASYKFRRLLEAGNFTDLKGLAG